jgi:hypothetical protein
MVLLRSGYAHALLLMVAMSEAIAAQKVAGSHDPSLLSEQDGTEAVRGMLKRLV